MSAFFTRLESNTFVDIPEFELHDVSVYQTRNNLVTLTPSLSKDEEDSLSEHIREYISKNLHKDIDNIQCMSVSNTYKEKDVTVQTPEAQENVLLKSVATYRKPASIRGKFQVSVGFSKDYISLISNFRGLIPGTLTYTAKVKLEEDNTTKYIVV